MTTERFEIKRTGEEWAIHHAGTVRGPFLTKEAALQVAANAGVDTLRLGNGLIICVDAAEADDQIRGTSVPTLAKS